MTLNKSSFSFSLCFLENPADTQAIKSGAWEKRPVGNEDLEVSSVDGEQEVLASQSRRLRRDRIKGGVCVQRQTLEGEPAEDA